MNFEKHMNFKIKEKDYELNLLKELYVSNDERLSGNDKVLINKQI